MSRRITGKWPSESSGLKCPYEELMTFSDKTKDFYLKNQKTHHQNGSIIRRIDISPEGAHNVALWLKVGHNVQHSADILWSRTIQLSRSTAKSNLLRARPQQL